jgi:hypothetical protein
MIEEIDETGDPWFATLLTVGTHHPFSASKAEVERYGDEKTAVVMAADGAVSEFYTELAERGVAEDTLIIITSDESHGVRAHPHGSAWGLMLAHGPDVAPEINPGVFGSLDTSISILDYLGFVPPPDMNGRSFFRWYENPRTMLFAVGHDIAMTERRGEFHICSRPRFALLAGEAKESECRTEIAVSGGMFARSYQQEPPGENLASYNKLMRLWEVLDGNVATDGSAHRLVLAKEVVTKVRDRDDFWLLGGQFFGVPDGTAARITMVVRYKANEDQMLRLRHRWVARVRGPEGASEAPVAEFTVPGVPSGGTLRLVFRIGGLAGMTQVEAVVQGRSGVGSVVVDEYSVEFEPDPLETVGAFELVEGEVRRLGRTSDRLEELTLADGPRQLVAVRLYGVGQTIHLTDPGEYLAYTMSDGWWGPEKWTSWTKERAHIYLKLGEVARDQVFAIEMASYLQPAPAARLVELRVNGRLVETWAVTSVDSPFQVYRTVIDARLLKRGLNDFVIHPVGDLVSPHELGRSGDQRKLGVGVRSFSMRPAGAG